MLPYLSLHFTETSMASQCVSLAVCSQPIHCPAQQPLPSQPKYILLVTIGHIIPKYKYTLTLLPILHPNTPGPAYTHWSPKSNKTLCYSDYSTFKEKSSRFGLPHSLAIYMKYNKEKSRNTIETKNKSKQQSKVKYVELLRLAAIAQIWAGSLTSLPGTTS